MKKIVNWFTVQKVLIILIAIFIVWFLSVIPNSKRCVESYKVKEIISLDYQNANIKLSNGRIVTVNQVKLKPGDNYCVKIESY